MTRKPLTISIIVVIAIIGAVITYWVISSRNLSPSGVANYSNDGLEIRVNYHRPSKRGRVIFGEASDGALQPNGKYWRLGANEATEISFNRDVTFGGKPVKAGTYRMYATLDERTWAIALNSELGQWGASEPDHELDVVRTEVAVEETPAETEQFTISFDGDSAIVNMHFAWDKKHAVVPIGVQ
jgi:hypothetical protein